MRYSVEEWRVKCINYESRGPQIVEKIVEKRVEVPKIVEKIVEKRIDVPYEVIVFFF